MMETRTTDRAVPRNATTSGLLLVDKPAGFTSHDAVAIVRRATHTRRVGHTGTLDPFATGLLVVLIGSGTRLIPYIDGEPKVYEAVVRFGAETDTDDVTGQIVRESDLPRDEAIVEGIARLTGEIDQLPPAYSAKQVDGRRAYDAARAGKPLELKPARVVVERWQLLARDGAELRVQITCGTGTYIRALARDLGRLTGSAAHLAELRRVRSGAFDVSNAVSIDDLRSERFRIAPLRAAIPDLPTRTLDDAERGRVSHGNAIDARDEQGRVALIDDAGELMAIAEREGQQLRPRTVLGNE
jgi:tRNA pseudouridine55 synthase